MPFQNVLYNMIMVVATNWVSLLAFLTLDRLKYFPTAFTNPVDSGSSFPCLSADSSTSESFLYRNTSTQMHTIVYANNVPIDIMFISWSRFKSAVTIPEEVVYRLHNRVNISRADRINIILLCLPANKPDNRVANRGVLNFGWMIENMLNMRPSSAMVIRILGIENILAKRL